MIRTYTREEMLDYWLRRLGFKASPQLSGISDPSGFHEALEAEVDAWYARLLATAPAESLPVTDIAGDVSSLFESEGVARVLLPDDVVRVLSLKMQGWDYPVTTFFTPGSRAARLQQCELTAATAYDPVVIAYPGRLVAFGVPAPESTMPTPGRPVSTHPQVESLRVIAPPADGSFVLDPALLPTSLNKTQ